MNARGFILPPTDALRRLADFLDESASPLSPAEAATAAIDEWIAAQRLDCRPLQATPTHGYQWKSLFLPDGTALRMYHRGHYFHAHVEGEHIVYQGQRVSPRQLTIAIAGSGHNAWRDLWLRLPADVQWRQANTLRRRGAHQAVPPQVSPQEAMASAAACMSQALKAALALVEHSTAHAPPKEPQPVKLYRRAGDILPGSCRFD